MAEVRRQPAGRSYRQYCAVARGLDVVGERWTLLIIRDLLTGPKRYSDLLAGLPGIGTNLLAARLREMQSSGLLRRHTLPPPAASTVYELTEVGQALEPAISALGRWGHRFLGARQEGDFLSPDAYLLAMRHTYDPSAAAGADITYELHIDAQVFEVRLEHGRCTTREGQAARPDVVLAMNADTLAALLGRELLPKEAIASRRVAIAAGNVASLETFVGVFGLPPAARTSRGRRVSSPTATA